MIIEIKYAYSFVPTKDSSKMRYHLKPTAGIVCYTTDRNDYTEDRNSMATIQPYFIPMGKKGLCWSKARSVKNLTFCKTLEDTITEYNFTIKYYLDAQIYRIKALGKFLKGSAWEEYKAWLFRL